MTAAISLQAQLPGENVLVLLPEAHYVAEAATGLVFREDTPIEVWSSLVTRLLAQRKRLEWAIADAINFGERRYGEMYAQWVDETGLAKRTLQNIASVGRRIENSRRREDVSFAHHAEVAYLPVADQESILDAAERAGMTRYELRDAVRERKRALDDRTVTEAREPADDLEWRPTKSDLADDARAALEVRLSEMSARHRIGFEAGFLAGLVYADALDCFVRES